MLKGKKQYGFRDRTWLKSARMKVGASQTDVAKYSGVSTPCYYFIENGQQMPNMLVGLKICKFLGVDPNLFLTEKTIEV